MKRILTSAELKLVADLLEIAADTFENHGSNDFYIPDTGENREIMLELYKDQGLEGCEVTAAKKHGTPMLLANNAMMMTYFSKLASDAS